MSLARRGVKVLQRWHCFGGELYQCSHASDCTRTDMRFSVFVPGEALAGANPSPTLYYLSGLTCTDENVMQKANAQRACAMYGAALVAPDTSPRGLDLPGEHDAYDFGSGAGFYLNATKAPWDAHYRMYDYVVEELPQVVSMAFPEVDALRRCGITGHSMGGHGALTIALKNPNMFRSVSAFAPICNPLACEWGRKAFSGYFQDPETEGAAYDATALMLARGPIGGKILIDQGQEDPFLSEGQLLPEAFAEACRSVGQDCEVRYRDGDHSYYFIATFFEDHVRHFMDRA